jgi:two-component system chemotaxis response regulator CheB
MTQCDVIAIGGSLGAIQAMKELCRGLPRDFAPALFMTIHVGAEGRDLLASILDAEAPIPITTAVDGEQIERGHGYVAPADHHLLVMDDVIRLGRGPRENLARPAIDPLFRSVGAAFGPRAIAVLLTGMLNDGSSGLADFKRCGGTTVVQNPLDAVASEMPRSALQASDIDYRAPIADMADLLVELSAREPGPAVPIPPDVRVEIEIALGRRADTEILAEIADPVALSCPACGGVLSEIKQWPPVRFRCQVGHAYTAEVLASEKEGAVDEATRVALRIMEERLLLIRKLAEDARKSGRHAAAQSFEKRQEECDNYAGILRQAIRQA